MRHDFSFRSLQVIASSFRDTVVLMREKDQAARLVSHPNIACSEECREYVLEIGDVKTFSVPVILQCHNVGAGVGLFMLDRAEGISGGAHILLPDDDEGRSGAGFYTVSNALERVFAGFVERGSSLSGLKAWIAGGATFFGFGQRNVQSVVNQLIRHKVSIAASDVGGKYCRTVRFNSTNSMMLVQPAGSNFYKVL